MRRADRRQPAERGVSLVEILVLIAVLGVVAMMGRPLLSSSLGDASLTAAVEEIVIAIQYAQGAALGEGQDHRVSFDKTLDRFVVERAAPDSATRTLLRDDLVGEVMGGAVEATTWEAVRHPLKRGHEYRVDLDEPRFRGADITVVNFAAQNWIRFDDWGEPSSGGTVRVQLGRRGWSVSVDEVTGIVTRAPLTVGEIQEVIL